MRIVAPQSPLVNKGDFKVTANLAISPNSKLSSLELLANNQALTVSQYQFIAAPNKSWQAIQAEIQDEISNGWHLVIINNQEEQDYLATELTNRFANITVNNKFLMGARQNANGNWQWADNSVFTYSAWWFGQPSALQGLAVGTLQKNQNWRWSAVTVTESQFIAGYILEREGTQIDNTVLSSALANNFDFVVKRNSLAAGNNTLVLQAKDSNGLVGLASLVATNRPDTSPVITHIAPDFLQLQTEGINVQGYVSLYGNTQLKSMSWLLTLPTTTPGGSIQTDSSGNFSFELPSSVLRPTDNLLQINALNTADQSTEEFYSFDFAPTNPAISIALKDGDTLTKAQIAGTIDLPSQQTAKIELIINNSTAQVLSANQTSGVFNLPFSGASLKPSNNTLAIKTTSNLGAVTQIQLEKINVAPPSVTITAPSANQTVNGAVHITGSVDSVLALSSIQLALDGVNQANIPNTAASPNFDFVIPSSALAAGSHTATVTAFASTTTAVAFSGFQSRTFIYTLPPKISLISPADGATLTDFVSVAGRFDLGAQSLKGLDIRINGAGATSLLQYTSGNQYSYYVSPSVLNDGANTIAVTITDSQGLSATIKREFTYKKPSVATVLLTPSNGGSASGDVVVSGKVYSAEPLSRATLTTSTQTTRNILANINTAGDFSVVLKASEILGNVSPLPQGNGVRLSLDASSSESKSQVIHSFTYFQNPTFVPGGDLVVINDIDPFYSKLSVASNAEFALNLVNFSAPGKLRAKASEIIFDEETAAPRDILALFTENNISITRISTRADADSFYKAIPDTAKVIFLWMPRTVFSDQKVTALKQFAREGGRIVFVGESSSGYANYINSVENTLFKQLGVELQANVDTVTQGAGLLQLAVSATPHQLTVGVKTLQLSTAASLKLGPRDFALLTDGEGNVLIGVTRADGDAQ